MNFSFNNIQRYLFSLLFAFSLFAISSAQTISVEENDTKAQQYLEQGNKTEAARLYTQSAYYYRNNNNLEKSIEYSLKVLELNKELNNRNGQMLSHSNLSMLYIEAEQFDKALEQLKEELTFRQQNKRLNEILPVLLTIASVETELNQYESAAITTEKAIEIAKEINELNFLKRAYGVAFDVYTKWNKQEKAQAYFELYSAIDKKLKNDMVTSAQTEARQANTERAITQERLQETSQQLERTADDLKEAERIKREQELTLDLQEAQINETKALLHIETLRKRFWAIGFIVAVFFVLALVVLFLKIRAANREIDAQRTEIEKQHKEIKSSINYAETIQQAMLPDLSEMDSFADSFILYRPKDIVSGDFYWSAKLSDETIFFAVVDCTGHGVPGAFMSMVGIRILRDIVQELKVQSPAKVLEHLNEMVRETLRQDQTDNNDGMDLVIVRLDKMKDGTTKVTYAGAKRPLYVAYAEKNEIEILSPDRKSIGGHQTTKQYVEFNDKVITLSKGDEMFLFSDGITDQNNSFRKKFGRARLESILTACMEDDVKDQQKLIESKLDEFMGDEFQRDDITLAGIKLK